MPNSALNKRPMPPRSLTDGDSGFVLFVVLVAVVAIASLAVILASATRADIRDLSADASLIKADAAAEAGITQALASFEDRADKLGLTPYTDDVEWTFGDVAIGLRMRQESSKIDVLHGNPNLIRHVVDTLIAAPLARQQVLERINQFRLKNEIPEDLSAILPPRLRVSSDARIFEEHLTILVDQKGVDPVGASAVVREALLSEHPGLADKIEQAVKWHQVTPDLAAELGDDYSLPANLFTIESVATLPNGVKAGRWALVTLDSDARRVFVLREAQLRL